MKTIKDLQKIIDSYDNKMMCLIATDADGGWLIAASLERKNKSDKIITKIRGNDLEEMIDKTCKNLEEYEKGHK